MVTLDRSVEVTTAGTTEPITLAQAKAHIRIATADTNDDTWITTCITSARQEAEGVTGIALVKSTYALLQDRFDGNEIILPWYPLVSVTGVYTAAFDSTDVLPATEFAATNYFVQTLRRPGAIFLKDSSTWPTDLRSERAVRVVYIAGYANATTDYPNKGIHNLLLQLISSHYWNRNGSDEHEKILNKLTAYRVFWV